MNSVCYHSPSNHAPYRNMKPRDCFGVVIRTIGLLLLIVSALYLNSALVTMIGRESSHAATPAYYLVASALTAGIGLYFLRGAPHLMRFAYGEEKSDSATSQTKPEEI
jgi:hypothetical protein